MPTVFQFTTSPNFVAFPKACELWACEHGHSRSNDYGTNNDFPPVGFILMSAKKKECLP